MCAIDYVLLGLDWAEPMMQFLLHVTCSCIPMHTYTFSVCLLSLSLSIYVSLLLWHPNVNMLRPETLFVPGHPHLLTLLLSQSGFVMKRPDQTSLRTFPDEAFISNASYQTSPTLTFLLSSTVEDGGHCVTS